MQRAARVAHWYQTGAVLLLNTGLLLLFCNGLAALALARIDRGTEIGPLSYGMERLAQAYPGWSEEEVRQLLQETWSREYVYVPFTQHAEAPVQGRYLNVDAHGFRVGADQGPWPPAEAALTLFVFGGSTTFGYGITDAETIPSVLQEQLSILGCGGDAPLHVYNFGGGNYYSEQERALFEQLIVSGIVPDGAIFIDGLNEWKEAPKFTTRLEYLIAESETQLVLRAIKSLALFDLMRFWRAENPEADPAGADSTAVAVQAQQLVDRWMASKKMIQALGDAFNVRTGFVWQPVPNYQYDLSAHLFQAESERIFADQRQFQLLPVGYQLMEAARSDPNRLKDDQSFLWLADVQVGRHEPFYVDNVHYTARFSRELGERLSRFVFDQMQVCDG